MTTFQDYMSYPFLLTENAFVEKAKDLCSCVEQNNLDLGMAELWFKYASDYNSPLVTYWFGRLYRLLIQNKASDYSYGAVDTAIFYAYMRRIISLDDAQWKFDVQNSATCHYFGRAYLEWPLISEVRNFFLILTPHSARYAHGLISAVYIENHTKLEFMLSSLLSRLSNAEKEMYQPTGFVQNLECSIKDAASNNLAMALSPLVLQYGWSPVVANSLYAKWLNSIEFGENRLNHQGLIVFIKKILLDCPEYLMLGLLCARYSQSPQYCAALFPFSWERLKPLSLLRQLVGYYDAKKCNEQTREIFRTLLQFHHPELYDILDLSWSVYGAKIYLDESLTTVIETTPMFRQNKDDECWSMDFEIRSDFLEENIVSYKS